MSLKKERILTSVKGGVTICSYPAEVGVLWGDPNSIKIEKEVSRGHNNRSEGLIQVHLMNV